jgi:hypothetical protein
MSTADLSTSIGMRVNRGTVDEGLRKRGAPLEEMWMKALVSVFYTLNFSEGYHRFSPPKTSPIIVMCGRNAAQL